MQEALLQRVGPVIRHPEALPDVATGNDIVLASIVRHGDQRYQAAWALNPVE
jgi:hypothetical protein